MKVVVTLNVSRFKFEVGQVSQPAELPEMGCKQVRKPAPRDTNMELLNVRFATNPLYVSRFSWKLRKGGWS